MNESYYIDIRKSLPCGPLDAVTEKIVHTLQCGLRHQPFGGANTDVVQIIRHPDMERTVPGAGHCPNEPNKACFTRLEVISGVEGSISLQDFRSAIQWVVTNLNLSPGQIFTTRLGTDIEVF